MRQLRRHIRARLTRLNVALLLSVTLGVASLVAIHPNAILGLLASSLSSIGGTTTTVFFTPYGDETIPPGTTTTIDININTRVPINALGATISFSKDTLEIVGISKERSFFDLWTEDTSIDEDSGEIHFSGGTTKQGGLMGTGTMLTLTVRTKTPGSALLQFKNVQVFPSNDTGKPIDTDTRTITYTIKTPDTLVVAGGGSSGAPSAPTATPPNLDLNGDGKINLVDLSILIFKMLGPYDPRYDFNMNGSVGLDDLSIMLSKM